MVTLLLPRHERVFLYILDMLRDIIYIILVAFLDLTHQGQRDQLRRQLCRKQKWRGGENCADTAFSMNLDPLA